MRPSAVGAWAIALVVGAVYGAAGSVAQSFVLWGIPVGLVLSFAACAAILIGVRQLTDDRISALATGAGIVLTVLLLSGEGPGGSVLLAQSIPAVVWTLGVPIIVAVVVGWPRSRASRADASPETAGSDGAREAN